VPLNIVFKEAELEFYFRESDVRAVIAEPRVIATVRRIAARLDRPVEIITTGHPQRGARSWESLLEGHSPLPLEPRPPDEECIYQYSSGLTGRAKRVPRTHRQLGAEAASVVATAGLDAGDKLIGTLPLHHSYGMGCCLLAAISCGATLLLPEGREPFVLRRQRTLELLEQEHVTVFPGVPAQFRFLAGAPRSADLSGLRLCFSGAAALPQSTFNEFKSAFGIPVRQLYGCTETGTLTMNLDEDPEPSSASVGRPIQHVQVTVIDDSGSEVEPGRIGEIAVSSPAMTSGYEGAPEANRLSFRDGRFLTADRGRIDDEGRVFITGRKKLLIDVLGEKVDPIEVEDVMATHPRVREVVVVGVPGDVEGEDRIKAVVVPDGRCEERELIRFCSERLANYKVPDSVEFREEIPKSPLGKVLRKYLVD
jgi:long-chain acyl-CoA synthetase